MWRVRSRRRFGASGLDRLRRSAAGRRDPSLVPLFELVEALGICVSLYDANGRLISYSPSFARRWASTPSESMQDLYPDFRDPALRDLLESVLREGTPLDLDCDDDTLSLHVFRVGDGFGIVECTASPGSDDEASAPEVDTLIYQAAHDVLTGLENRRRLSERLEDELQQTDTAGPVALLQIDLDNFKMVNDTLGHGAGDGLLCVAAERIAATLGPDASAYRYAGDEFAVILTGEAQPDGALALANQLIEALNEPFRVNDMQLFVGGSIGIAYGPDHGRTGEELMKAADIALYAAKNDGRGCARLFEAPMLDALQRREQLRRSLREALAKGELSLDYQPLVGASGRVSGFEALLRWRHPVKGLIPPAVFIPIAEADGLMDEIGGWVLETACRQATRWPPHLTVAVNLSPAQFLGGRLTDRIARVLDLVGLQAERLELEITETVLLEKTVDNLDTLNTLNVLGIKISLDDFGTSYSSLGYLKNFPFDTLKIDRYFIADVELDSKSQTIVRSILGLAHGLGMNVTAEGVETAAQARWLTAKGCDRLQGYYLGQPMTGDQTLDFLSRLAAGTPGPWNDEGDGETGERA